MSRDRVRPDQRVDPDSTDQDTDQSADVEDPTSRRRRRPDQSGSVDDLQRDQSDQGGRETALGSETNLRIAEAFDPGFVNTEFINRIAFADSFNFIWDIERGEWRPLTTADLLLPALEQGLISDNLSDQLGDVISDQDGTVVDDDGSIGLDNRAGLGGYLPEGDQQIIETTDTTGIGFQAGADVSRVSGEIAEVGTPPSHVEVYESATRSTVARIRLDGLLFDVEVDLDEGLYYRLYFDREGDPYLYSRWQQDPRNLNTSIGSITRDVRPNSSGFDYLVNVIRLGERDLIGTGTATTALSSPSRSTRYDRSIFNARRNGGDVTVDLYEGDPNSPDSTLLKKDLSERADLSGINANRSDLQYKITLERGPDGSSPVVETIGFQYVQ